MTETVFRALEQALTNKEVIQILVDEVTILTEQINHKFPKKLKLHFEFWDSPHIEASGWILDIDQAGVDFFNDFNYFSDVAKFEITELEVNDGKVKATFYDWIEGGEKKSDSFGRSVSMEPIKFIEFLQNVAVTGESRPEFTDQED